ncbi:hypothetical protein [Nocardia sp. NPDC050175]|uniref:hypothetical protein n=1 Tax=Nocardia sp. NPDC050175 TaxID=3364317 RepID=UPI0037BCC227
MTVSMAARGTIVLAALVTMAGVSVMAHADTADQQASATACAKEETEYATSIYEYYATRFDGEAAVEEAGIKAHRGLNWPYREYETDWEFMRVTAKKEPSEDYDARFDRIVLEPMSKALQPLLDAKTKRINSVEESRLEKVEMKNAYDSCKGKKPLCEKEFNKYIEKSDPIAKDLEQKEKSWLPMTGGQGEGLESEKASDEWVQKLGDVYKEYKTSIEGDELWDAMVKAVQDDDKAAHAAAQKKFLAGADADLNKTIDDFVTARESAHDAMVDAMITFEDQLKALTKCIQPT